MDDGEDREGERPSDSADRAGERPSTSLGTNGKGEDAPPPDAGDAGAGEAAGPLHRPLDEHARVQTAPGSQQPVRGTGGPSIPRPGEELYDGARIIPNKNRALQVCESSRKSFDEGRKRVFLEWFAGTGNLSLSAREADISYKTVLRHRAVDAGFRADFDEALDQSKIRLRAWAMEARDDGRTEYDPEAHAPAHLDAAQVVQLLRDEAQRERARDAAAASGRRPSVASNDEVRAALIRAMVAEGLRVRGADSAPDHELREGEGEGAL